MTRRAMLAAGAGAVAGMLLPRVGAQEKNPTARAAPVRDQPRLPIIDMHLHTFRGPFPDAQQARNPVTGKLPSVRNDEEAIKACLTELKRLNVVKAVVSGPLEAVRRWREADPDRFIGGLSLLHNSPPLPKLAALRREFKSGNIRVLGELGLQYIGLAPNDRTMRPYFALAEELDIPVALHTGLGPPGMPYEGAPKFRNALGNPALLEEVLVRHPKLRVYLMHAGHPWFQETVAIMSTYPQVYADLAVLNWIYPRTEFHDYLKRLLQNGLGKQLMFGSDQMLWPEAIEMSIVGTESAEFLSAEQQRDIFYNNAARFLRLEKKE